MEKKKSIFDVVFFNGDLNLIKLRIKTNIDFIWKMIIVSNSENYKMFDEEIWKNEKITFLIDEENFENYEYFSETLKKKLLEDFKRFDDIILISQENEIPTLSDSILDELNTFSDSFFFHKVVNEKNNYRKFLEKGTAILNFNIIATDHNFLSSIFTHKKSLVYWLSNQQNGFTYVQSPYKDEHYKCPYSNKIVPYIKNSNEVTTKKILISFNVENTNQTSKYDYIFVVKTKNQFPEVINYAPTFKTKFIELYLPTQKIYDVENFDRAYLRGETLRILNSIPLNESDLVHLKFSDSEFEEYTIKELKNPS